MTEDPVRLKLQRLLHSPVFPGVLLIVAMLAALVAANVAPGWYGSLLNITAVAGVGEVRIEKPVLLWINDGLMAVFFLLVGLELKREVLFGELADKRKVILPLFGALGGIAIPTVIYVAINRGDPVALNGWAIPAATDIAFALGILALLGSRVPIGLKILLTSIAVMDDLAAIVIIALFYTNQLSALSLGSAAVLLAVLIALNRFGVRSAAPYVLIGIAMWVAVLKSGVHATLAGVALAMVIPSHGKTKEEKGLAARMEHGLHSWVIFAILPVFAFANAGVPLTGMTFEAFTAGVPLGIALGLFVGKQVGVFGFCWIAVRLKLASLPKNVTWPAVYGMALLCGVGFTMSLFIGSLAFEATGGPDYAVDDRLGILAGSLLSAIGGFAVLWFSLKRGEESRKVAAWNEGERELS